MASIIKGKIKQSPSGLCSVIFSHVPVAASGLNPCRTYRNMELLILACSIACCGAAFQCLGAGCLESPLTWQSCQSSAKSDSPPCHDPSEVGLIAGKGGLGHKEKMSWKSSVNLRERMAASELEFSQSGCWFLTLTQPSIDIRAYEALARYSSYAIDRLNREFNRYFEGQNFSRCSVWEYQDRGSLHVHILLASDCIHAMDIEDFRLHICKVWYRILQSISNKFESDPFLSSYGHKWSLDELKHLKNEKEEYIFANCQQVVKSVVAYLSSYLSGSNHDQDKQSKNDKREKFYPVATWCQWNKKATELFDKYSDNFDLGICEPDRKKELLRIKESLHFDLLKKIPLARNTEIKQPQNPYNEGLYFIPAKAQSSSLARLLSGYIEKLSHIFKPEINPDIPQRLEDDYGLEWTLWDVFESLKGRFKRIARKLFFSGISPCQTREKLLELAYAQSEKLKQIEGYLSPKSPTQLESNYGF